MTRFDKISTLWQNFKCLGLLFEVIFCIGHIFNLFVHIFRIMGKFSLLLMAHYWRDNLAIWSHWSYLLERPCQDYYLLRLRLSPSTWDHGRLCPVFVQDPGRVSRPGLADGGQGHHDFQDVHVCRRVGDAALFSGVAELAAEARRAGFHWTGEMTLHWFVI